jgi:hypothetical protein
MSTLVIFLIEYKFADRVICTKRGLNHVETRKNVVTSYFGNGFIDESD